MSQINGDKIQGSHNPESDNFYKWAKNISQLITDPVQDYVKGSGKMPQSEYHYNGWDHAFTAGFQQYG